MKYAHVEFENANDRTTETIVEELWNITGYNHITGSAGMLYFAYTGKTLAQITEAVQAVVWKHNGGMFVEVVERTEKDFEDIL